jgi:hypothetical protein
MFNQKTDIKKVDSKVATVEWPNDATRIDVRDRSEVDFWCTRFQVSAGNLRHAVRRVGARWADVVHELERRRQATG